MNPDDVDNMDFPLPVSVDDFSTVKPVSATYTQETDAFKGWICVYPIYFDASIPIKKGRKVKKSLAINNPNVIHLLYAVNKLNIKTCFEPTKRHPRTFDNFGRIRVNLLLDNGFYADQEMSTKKHLINKLAELLPEAQRSIGEIDHTDPEAVIAAGQRYLRTSKR